MIDFVRIAVGVNGCNDGDVQFASFENSDVLLAGVNDEESARKFLHIFIAAKVFGQFFLFMTQAYNFFFRE